MNDILIRPAVEADLAAINDIYNYYVTRSTCTYQEESETMAGRGAWFAAHDEEHPITVAVARDGTVVGWGSLSPFHKRSAYRRTVENSVYVSHEHQRRGIGRALLADLIERARTAGHHTIVAVIDADQAGSIALHVAMGFRDGGELRELGFKFGRWLNVRYLQLML
jgi:phosphinothricin acetyltransferase